MDTKETYHMLLDNVTNVTMMDINKSGRENTDQLENMKQDIILNNERLALLGKRFKSIESRASKILENNLKKATKKKIAFKQRGYNWEKILPFKSDEEVISFFDEKTENLSSLVCYLNSRFKGRKVIEKGILILLDKNYRASRVWDDDHGSSLQRPAIPNVFRNFIYNLMWENEESSEKELENPGFWRRKMQHLIINSRQAVKKENKFIQEEFPEQNLEQ